MFFQLGGNYLPGPASALFWITTPRLSDGNGSAEARWEQSKKED